MSRNMSFVLLLAAGVVAAVDAPEAQLAGAAVAQAPKQGDAAQEKAEATMKEEDAKKKDDPKSLSGMSILGNQEAPKALVIVPWKSSDIGQSVGISTMLDDSRQPIDKDVFMRMLSYYEVRSTTDAAQPVTAAQRR